MSTIDKAPQPAFQPLPPDRPGLVRRVNAEPVRSLKERLARGIDRKVLLRQADRAVQEQDTVQIQQVQDQISLLGEQANTSNEDLSGNGFNLTVDSIYPETRITGLENSIAQGGLASDTSLERESIPSVSISEIRTAESSARLNVDVRLIVQAAFRKIGILSTARTSEGSPKLSITVETSEVTEQRGSNYSIFGIFSDSRTDIYSVSVTLSAEVWNAQNTRIIAVESGQAKSPKVNIRTDQRRNNGYGNDDERLNPDEQKRQIQLVTAQQAADEMAANVARHLPGGSPIPSQRYNAPAQTRPENYGPRPRDITPPQTEVKKLSRFTQEKWGTIPDPQQRIDAWLNSEEKDPSAPVLCNGVQIAKIIRHEPGTDRYLLLLDPNQHIPDGKYSITIPLYKGRTLEEK